MKYRPDLDRAISELAALWPKDGELEAAVNPVGFIRRVTEEIVALRRERDRAKDFIRSFDVERCGFDAEEVAKALADELREL